MVQGPQRLLGSLVMAVFLFNSFGCDLINPPKKTSKKTLTPAAANSPSPTSTTPSTVTADASAPMPQDAVARVGNWTLTTEEFDQHLKMIKEGYPEFDATKPGVKTSILETMVRQELLVQEAQEKGLSQQKEIEDAVEELRRNLMAQDALNRLVKDITVSEKDAKEYYDQNKEIFVEPIQWKVREIVVAEEGIAKNIKVQLLQGGDFGEIAKMQSKGKTAANGGVLPEFTKAPFAAMQTVLSSLEVGASSDPIKGPEGFYIVKVDEKKGGIPKAFEEVKKPLMEGLTEKMQQEAVLKHFEELKLKTKVEINKELLGDAAK